MPCCRHGAICHMPLLLPCRRLRRYAMLICWYAAPSYRCYTNVTMSAILLIIFHMIRFFCHAVDYADAIFIIAAMSHTLLIRRCCFMLPATPVLLAYADIRHDAPTCLFRYMLIAFSLWLAAPRRYAITLFRRFSSLILLMPYAYCHCRLLLRCCYQFSPMMPYATPRVAAAGCFRHYAATPPYIFTC